MKENSEEECRKTKEFSLNPDNFVIKIKDSLKQEWEYRPRYDQWRFTSILPDVEKERNDES